MFRFFKTVEDHQSHLKNLLRALITGLSLIIFVKYTPQAFALNNAASQPSAGSIRFAAIGDYGAGNSNELAVANLIKSWNPDFIITLGDNNYPDGAASTIDGRIGQYFHDYIYPYTGTYTPGSTTNRFFPALGNHDWITSGAAPYINYFSLPNNERYYTFTQGPAEFFVMDSDSREPDGISVTSVQAAWLRQQLIASSATWKIVYFHHPPYSSGSTHGSTSALQWPFQQWGASAVLSAHEHNYERILHDGIPYMVNGLGGASLYNFGTPVAGSQVRYNTTYGAQLIDASADHITFQFYSIANGGTLIDSYTINGSSATATPNPTSTTIPNQTPTATNTTLPNQTPAGTLTPIPTPTITRTLTPTTTSVSGNTLTLTSVADSYVSAGSPSSSFGLSTTLRTDGSPIQRSYLRFDLPTPSGNVTSAKLRIYANTAVSIGYTLHSTTGAWAETTINYNNAPAFGSGIGSSGAITANSWTQVDVTPLVTAAGQYNFVIDTNSSTATSLSSREGANPPQLVITMSGGSGGSSLTSTNTPTTTPAQTVTPLSTLTPIPTNTSTQTQTMTAIPTATTIPTNTPILTNTATNTATLTNTPIPTATQTMTAIPTATAIPTSTLTATPSITAVPTLTDTNTPTLTLTYTPTQDPCQPPYGSGGKPPECK